MMAGDAAKLCVRMAIAMLLCIAMQPKVLVRGDPQIPCLFFFGDSQFDNGNNNDLVTKAKANYLPYGIDYGDGNTPTGRFSNGKNIPDYIAQFLGYQTSIPSWASTAGNPGTASKGVNYASGGSGILENSGTNLGERYSMDEQLKHHESTIPITGLSSQSLQQCLYIINIGSNDYINNYYLNNSLSRSQFTPSVFADKLITKYSTQLKALHDLGARKIAVFNVGLIGCIPQELELYPPTNGSPCVDFINAAVSLFNEKLKALVTQLSTSLIGTKFTYINAFAISASGNPALGFTVLNAPCCAVSESTESTTAAVGQCDKNSAVPPCPDRTKYVFYDNFHPTEHLNAVMACVSCTTPFPAFANPYSLSALALA